MIPMIRGRGVKQQISLCVSLPRRHKSFMSCIRIESLNPHFLNVEYAVRGELAIKAEEYRVKLKSPNHGLPFDKVVSSNIGNPQQKGLDQKPLTFNRQVRSFISINCSS
jgi:hypothetical protein